MIKGVAKVVVAVSDQDRALRFWTDRLGFHVVREEERSDGRWIEVAPRDGSVVLVLRHRRPDEAPPEAPADLPQSNVVFTADDVVYTYQVLAERGVRFPVSPMKYPSGWWAMFEDDDGTRYGLAQW